MDILFILHRLYFCLQQDFFHQNNHYEERTDRFS